MKKLKKFVLAWLGCWAVCPVWSGEQGLSISTDPERARVQEVLNYLCNNECVGRDTGTSGERIAGNYLADHFKKIGLKGMMEKGKPKTVPDSEWAKWPWPKGVLFHSVDFPPIVGGPGNPFSPVWE